MSIRMVSLCIVFFLTAFSTGNGLSSEGPEALSPAEDAKWERRLEQVIGLCEIPHPEKTERVLTNILGVLSGFQFEIGENVGGKAALRMQNNSLSEILDVLLLPEGYVWERNGTTIKVWLDQHAARRRELLGATPEKETKEAKLRESLDRKLEGPLAEWKPKNVSYMLRDILAFTPTDNHGGYAIHAAFDDEVHFEVGDKTVQEILDEVLPPLGLNWDVVGDTLIVTRSFRRRFFPLKPAEVERLKEILGLESLDMSTGDDALYIIAMGDQTYTIRGDWRRFERAVHQILCEESAGSGSP